MIPFKAASNRCHNCEIVCAKTLCKSRHCQFRKSLTEQGLQNWNAALFCNPLCLKCSLTNISATVGCFVVNSIVKTALPVNNMIPSIHFLQTKHNSKKWPLKLFITRAPYFLTIRANHREMNESWKCYKTPLSSRTLGNFHFCKWQRCREWGKSFNKKFESTKTKK